MLKLEMDMEKLEAKTQARVDYVLECYSLGLPVNWEAAEFHAEMAAVDLVTYMSTEAFREMGRAARQVVEAFTAMVSAFSEGYSEND